MKKFALRALLFSPFVVALGCSSSDDMGPLRVRSSGPNAEAPDGEGEGAAVDPSGSEEIAGGAKPIDVVVPVDLPPGEESSAETQMAFAQPAGPTVVYLNRRGRTFTGGSDDSARGVSSVVSHQGFRSINFPAARYSQGEWDDLVGRVRAYFDPYNVQLVEERPASGAYVELAIGDTTASILNLSQNVGGVAPLGPCRVVSSAIGFVFGRIYDQRGYGGIPAAAEAVAHEIGHSLSLSHESLASDLMSYAPPSAQKRFQDAASYCGTTPRAESCSCGAQQQNSHEQLARVVGARQEAPPATPPEVPPASGDSTAPTVSIVSPAEGARLGASTTIEVAVDAADDQALGKVELFWSYTNRLLACDASVAGVTCTRAGARTTWRIGVGSGERKFYAVATDAAGNRAQSATRTIQLGDPAPATPPTATANAAPVIAVRSPAAGATVTRGGEVVFEAEVTDDKAVADVRALWTYGGGTLEFVLSPTDQPNVYRSRAAVSATAAAGARSIVYQATDDAGGKTVSPKLEVIVR